MSCKKYIRLMGFKNITLLMKKLARRYDVLLSTLNQIMILDYCESDARL